MDLYRTAQTDDERRNTEITIFEATALPASANFSNELLVTVLNDSVRVVGFCREIAATEAYEILQKAEDRLLWLHRHTQQIHNDPKMDAATSAAAERLSESIRSFREVAEPFLYETCKELVQSLPVDDSLLNNVQIILQTTGGVFGEFGFVEAHQKKREAMVPWLSDIDEKVRSFAAQYIGLLDRQIAAEQRRSEEDLEMRKRRYDSPPHDPEQN